jgi:transcription antitermination factor NusG
MNDESRWFALKVRHQHEQAAATVLGLKQLEAFAPTLRQRRRWSDRTKVLVTPLFPSYVFCRFENEKRLSVLNTPGVLSIVGFGNSPAPVPDEEIAAVRTAIASGMTIEPWPYLRAGERVEVTHGPLKSLKGVLVQSKNDWRVVVSVDLLMRSLAVEVDRDCLARLRA